MADSFCGGCGSVWRGDGRCYDCQTEDRTVWEWSGVADGLKAAVRRKHAEVKARDAIIEQLRERLDRAKREAGRRG